MNRKIIERRMDIMHLVMIHCGIIKTVIFFNHIIFF